MDMHYLFSPEPPPEESISSAASIIRNGRMFRYDYGETFNSPVSQVEQSFAEALGCKYALAVNSCGSAIQLALLSAGAQPGDLILVPGFTFTAVTSAIINCGCRPILVDIEDDYCIDISDLRRKYRDGMKFLLMSYMRGRVARLDAILDFCDFHNLVIIEDCAHSLGTYWCGRPTGVFGVASCFSFHDKLLSSGEGGILATNNDHLLMQAAVMSGTYENLWKRHSSHPNLDNPYQGTVAQFSMRMSAVTAAILQPQIPLICSFAEEYRARYRLFTTLLSKSDHIRLPRDDKNAELVSNTIQFELINMKDSMIEKALTLICNAGIPLARFGMQNRNDRCVWNWRYLEDGIEHSVPNCLSVLPNTCDLRIRRTMSTNDISAIAELIVHLVDNAVT